MKKLKFWIQDYFGFAPKETKGFLMLMLLIFFLLILPLFVKFIIPVKDTTESDKKQLDELIAKVESDIQIKDKNSSVSERPVILSLFNPNTVDEEKLIDLGLDKKVAKRILNYRNKGGKFLIKADFKKVYGLTEEKYLELFPFINLPERKEEKIAKSYFTRATNYKEKEAKTEKTFIPFDINTADTAQLIAIKGIGSKLAKRIITYRDKLGGFVSKNQFKEVFGLDSVVVWQLEKSTILNPSFTPHKINLNTSNFDELRKHPYISFATATTIIAYRQQHGPYKSLAEIKNIHNIKPETIIKLEPYLSL